eukprot:5963065-Prymnesium_polylepis.1
MRRARWHVQASEAVDGVRRRGEPSYVLPSTIHAGGQARPVLATSPLQSVTPIKKTGLFGM